MEEFVTFEIAKKLKDKGFREECLCHYVGDDLYYNIESPIANNQFWFSHNKYDNIWHRDNVDAPTFSQVLKWLREEKKLYVGVTYSPKIEGSQDFYYPTIQYIGDYQKTIYVNGSDIYDSYEQATLAGIEYVLDNLI